MIITMTTIGYGDLYVRSTFARFIVIMTGFYGILVTSLLVVAFTNLLEMESSESNAFKIIKSKEVQKLKDLMALHLTSDIFRSAGTYEGESSPNLGRKDKTFYRKRFIKNLRNYVDIK